MPGEGMSTPATTAEPRSSRPATSGRSTAWQSVRTPFYQVLVVVGFLSAWELTVRVGLVEELFVSRPLVVIERLWEMLALERDIYSDLVLTLYETVVAFGIGTVLGIVLGYLVGTSQAVSNVFRPFAEIGNALPKVVLGPIFILWFGLGPGSKIALGASLVVFLVFFDVYNGLRDVDARLVRKLRVMGGSARQVRRYVLFPSVLTWILGGFRIAFGYALAGAIVSEYLASGAGIGHVISRAQGNFDTTTVFAGLILVTVFVGAASLGMDRLERYLLRWRPQSKNIAHGM